MLLAHCQDIAHQLTLAVDRNIQGSTKQCEQYLQECKRAYLEVQGVVQQANSIPSQVEIEIFKHIVPTIKAHHLFFAQVYTLLPQLSVCHSKQRDKLIVRESKKLHATIPLSDIHLYYYQDCSHLDDLYFLRSAIPDSTQCLYLASETPFATLHSDTYAQIMMREWLLTWLNRYKSSHSSDGRMPLNWSASKTDFVELIYALHHAGALRSDISTIAETLSAVMGLDVRRIYVTWSEIKARKLTGARFLQSLTKALEKARSHH